MYICVYLQMHIFTVVADVTQLCTRTTPENENSTRYGTKTDTQCTRQRMHRPYFNPISTRQAEREAALEQVRNELAFDSAKSQLALDKLRAWYSDHVEVDTIQIGSFGNGYTVATIRQARIPKDTWTEMVLAREEYEARVKAKEVEMAARKAKQGLLAGAWEQKNPFLGRWVASGIGKR